MDLTIHGYSTALFSTWYFVEELGILFDAGDGITAALAQKSRKIKHVFISHADRDHVTGLLQLIQLNGQKDSPVVYYPADCNTFPALEEFLKRFDPHVQRPAWVPVRPGQEIQTGKDIIVKLIRNGHVNAPPEKSKSLSFIIQRAKKKLRPEFAALSGKEIAALRANKSADEIMEEVRENLLGFSADTPVEDMERWKGVPTLIHEATFLTPGELSTHNETRNLHSVLSQVIGMVAATDVQRLILGHFSSRYSDDQIETALRAELQQHQLNIPVKTILPGRRAKITIRKGQFE